VRINDVDRLIDELEKAFDLADESDSKPAMRAAYIADVMANGGKGFLERVRRYGATDKGEPLRMPRWFCELLELLGDFRIPHVLTTGCSQLGKTQSNTLLLTDLVVHGKLNSAWFYASRSSRDLNVPEQFYPVVSEWLDRLSTEVGSCLGAEADRQNMSRYQIDGTTAIFSYANTSKPTPSRSGLASAGGAAVSFTANVNFYEERSQWIPGTADPLIRRLDASLVPTRPIRELGTPGAGQGIEVEVDRASRWFYPHFECEHCGEVQPLDPKGCLLKRFDRRDVTGKTIAAYFSVSGRPHEWHHSNPHDPIESAYFGCAYCGTKIADKVRDRSWMQCRKTGVMLRNFLDYFPGDDGRMKVAIHLSPLCRMTQNNLAAELIRGGIEALRPEDWQQQGLGHPSETSTNSVSIDMIKASIAAMTPDRKPTVTIAGVDKGRGEDWLWIMDVHFPENWDRMPVSEAIEQAIRVVRFGADVVRSNIPELLDRYGVEYGLVDNEPDRADASALCGRTVLEMANQVGGLKDVTAKTIVKDGGLEYPCWNLRNEKFLKQVLTNFTTVSEIDHLPLYRLPDEWDKWIGVQTERSPVRHLTGPSCDPDTGAWKRGAGNIDDLYYSALFAEAALYLWVLNKPFVQFSFKSAGRRATTRF
jgi:hypothetical protein